MSFVKFFGYIPEKNIGALWPVIGKCLAVAKEHPAELMKGWLAIAVELLRVPEDITPLYEAVEGFVEWYYEIINVAPTIEEPKTNEQ